MAVARRKPAEVLFGSAKPRIAPPTPARTAVDKLIDAAASINVTLMPWQETAGRYIYALGRDDQWLYAEVALIVSRQAGKTAIMKPHIKARLRMGRRILHAAQKRDFVRKMFERDIVPFVRAEWPDAIVRSSGGQESIFLPSTGGSYAITAATGGGPRGLSIDDLIMDEIRELGEDFVEAAKATQAASLDPQTVYLSNAGSDDSDALNAVRRRAEEDPALAWLEWSAAPQRQADDVAGWAEANPSLGHFPGQRTFLERTYRSHKLAGTLAHFETEHLCRWVSTMRQALVSGAEWSLCRADDLEVPRYPFLGVSMSPDGKRASVVVSWKREDGTIGLRSAIEGTGNPIATGQLMDDVKALATDLGIRADRIGYDPLTDAILTKYFKKPKPIGGQLFSNASAIFTNHVRAGRIRWADADPVTDDLTWTSRKDDHETGSYQAVRAQDDRPITAALAAIRAVWMADRQTPTLPRVM